MKIKAKKSLGQHFLNSEGVVSDIVSAASISKTDTIVEIGPGRGVLTEKLLISAKCVVAIEKDSRLVFFLQEKFAKDIKRGRFVLINEDILKFNLSNHKVLATGYKLVANIPYYITGKILRLFLGNDSRPQKMVLLVQKEVANRIVADDQKESMLSMGVKTYGTPLFIREVSASCFTPQPKVDSAVLAIENISGIVFSEINKDVFFNILKTGFSQKRKQLKNNLLKIKNEEKIVVAFSVCNIPKNTRAEDLTMKDWICLAKKL